MGIVRFALRFPLYFLRAGRAVVFLGVRRLRSAIGTFSGSSIFLSFQLSGSITVSARRRWSSVSPPTPVLDQLERHRHQDMEAQTLERISVQKIYFQPDVNLDLAIAEIVAATNSIRVLMPPESSRRWSCNSMPRAFRASQPELRHTQPAAAL